jgi:hypothetical protein
MSWIRGNWEPEWIKKAEEVVLALVGFQYYTHRILIITSSQMTTYRERDDNVQQQPQNQLQRGELHFMDLAHIYDMDDLMYEGQSHQTHADTESWTVNNEFESWCSTLSPKGTDPLEFYNVSFLKPFLLVTELD